jgi:hypothetical protein
LVRYTLYGCFSTEFRVGATDRGATLATAGACSKIPLLTFSNDILGICGPGVVAVTVVRLGARGGADVLIDNPANLGAVAGRADDAKGGKGGADERSTTFFPMVVLDIALAWVALAALTAGEGDGGAAGETGGGEAKIDVAPAATMWGCGAGGGESSSSAIPVGGVTLAGRILSIGAVWIGEGVGLEIDGCSGGGGGGGGGALELTTLLLLVTGIGLMMLSLATLKPSSSSTTGIECVLR